MPQSLSFSNLHRIAYPPLHFGNQMNGLCHCCCCCCSQVTQWIGVKTCGRVCLSQLRRCSQVLQPWEPEVSTDCLCVAFKRQMRVSDSQGSALYFIGWAP